jgi:hypothetical protein
MKNKKNNFQQIRLHYENTKIRKYENTKIQ